MAEQGPGVIQAEPVPPRMKAERVRGSKPWLHALAVYPVAMAISYGFWWLQYNLPANASGWAWPFLATQILLTTAAFASLGWAFNRAGKRWIWAGVTGCIFAMVGPNVFVIAGLLGSPLALLQGVAPALATLILYRGTARITGIWLLSIEVALYISVYVLILIALANWKYQF